MLRLITVSAVLSCFALFASPSLAASLVLDYYTIAGAAAHADIEAGENEMVPSPWSSSDTAQDFSWIRVDDGAASTSATAQARLYAFTTMTPGPNPEDPTIYTDVFSTHGASATSYANVTVNGLDVEFASSIVQMLPHEYLNYDPTGRSQSDGWTSITGTMDVLGDAPGQEVTLHLSAVVVGYTTDPWDWFVKVWRGQDQVALMEGLTTHANLLATTGETLSFQMVHMPEPASLSLLALGLIGILRRRPA